VLPVSGVSGGAQGLVHSRFKHSSNPQLAKYILVATRLLLVGLELPPFNFKESMASESAQPALMLNCILKEAMSKEASKADAKGKDDKAKPRTEKAPPPKPLTPLECTWLLC
jgi:hypothetical protein